jgi:hypothetical protein
MIDPPTTATKMMDLDLDRTSSYRVATAAAVRAGGGWPAAACAGRAQQDAAW